MLQHVVNTLPRKELIGVASLTQTIKEQGQVMMVIQLLNLNLRKEYIIIIIVWGRERDVTFHAILFPLVSCSRAMGKSPLS